MNNPAFTLLEERDLPEVTGTVRLWKHVATGAQILSVINADENKCFGVSFRTPPKDSTGVAHILEHSVLCGSDKYPVKEPFVVLYKSSLQTFLNAFTFPDKTCYPIASANLQDFYNLIDVYIDAVFHPTISENTFRQEGWHVEADTPDGEWSYKGVVFNEMKGVYSSPASLLSEQVQHSLFPDTLYSLDSGGNPANIPDLTYEEFRDFHSTYYHPSNSRFFFWGDDPEERRLEIVAEALEGYGERPVDSTIPMQAPLTTPRQIEEPYAVTEDEANPKALFAINWLLGDRCDTDLCLILDMLEHILEGLAGSPLRRALISSGLGEDTVGCGLETELRQMYYSTGLRGIDPADVPKAEMLIYETLATLAYDGIPQSAIEAAMNSIEFSLRESNSGSFPRGLAAMLQALAIWNYDGNPIDAMAWEAPLNRLKERLASGEKVFEEAIRTLFLENESHTTVILMPDRTLASRLEETEAARIEAVRRVCSPEDRAEVCRITAELKEAQEAIDSPEALATIPVLSVGDLPLKNRVTEKTVSKAGEHTVLSYDLPTRGILYTSVHIPMPEISADMLPILPQLTRSMRHVGTARRDYTELGALISAKTGGLGVSSGSCCCMNGDLTMNLTLSGKTLSDRMDDFYEILSEILLEPATDKDVVASRLKEMLLEDKARLEQGIISAGNAAVQTRIQSCFTRDAAIAEAATGIEYLAFIRDLIAHFDERRDSLLSDIATLRENLVATRPSIVSCVGTKDACATCVDHTARLLSSLPAGTSASGLQSIPVREICPAEVFVSPSQVNYVGKGCNLYQLGYSFTGASLVILRYLRTGYLWDTVRVKGGAYGASCSLNRATGNFTCTSYRDPNVESTLAAYDGIAEYLAHCDLDADELSRAIVGAIGDLDVYLLPDARASRSLINYMSGDTDELRQQMRDQMLSVTLADFRAFSEVMAEARDKGIVSVIGGQRAGEYAKAKGWKCVNLFE